MANSSKKYDLIIIGSGPAGLAALEAGKEAGAKRIALLESYKRLGGECPNWGCMPTKSFLQTVDVLEHCSRGADFGVPSCGGKTDFIAARDRQRRVVDTLTGGSRLPNYVRSLGATLIKGKAKFVGLNKVKIRGQVLTGKKIVGAFGTGFFVPPILGLDKVPYLTAPDALALDCPPKSMLIIGGGPIGVEFSKIFTVFRTKVTVVEFNSHILPREDHDIAKLVTESMRRLNVTTMASSKVAGLRKVEKGIEATIEPVGGGKPKKLVAETVLVATGKRHLWKDFGAEEAGIKLDKRGAPVITRYLRTSNHDVFAAGDAAGRSMFTSVAHREGGIAARNAMTGKREFLDLRVMPRGTYGDPEVGSVGLTEEQAVAQGIEVAVGLGPFGALSKAMVTGEPLGVTKIVCDRKTRKIIGGHVVGHSAAEIVHALAVAMRGNLTCDDLADMLYAFPTYSESISLAALNVE